MNRRNRALWRAIAPVALMAVIFYLSAQPAAAHHPWYELIARKLGHVTGYALLTALWAWTLQGVVRRPLVWAVAISLAYACTDEFHQTFVHGRNGTPVDVGVDALGMAIASLAILLAERGPVRAGPRSSPDPSP